MNMIEVKRYRYIYNNFDADSKLPEMSKLSYMYM